MGFLLIMVVVPSWAQQKQVLSQYMFNGQVINPAYSGVHEKLSLTAIHRDQWVNLEGAPSTQTFTGNVGLQKNRIGLGFLISNDKLGVHNDLSLYLSYSYKIHFRNGALSMGLQGGFSNLVSDFDRLNLKDPGLILLGKHSNFNPNFGAGIFYYSDIAYVGLSVPFIMRNDLSDIDEINQSLITAKEYRYYYFTAGRLFDMSDRLQFKPSTLIRHQENAPLRFDLNANIIVDELFTLGASYRSGDAFVGLFELQLNENFRLGYAYDFTQSDLNQFSKGSHEIMLNYRVDISRGISGKFIPCPSSF